MRRLPFIGCIKAWAAEHDANWLERADQAPAARMIYRMRLIDTMLDLNPL
jgi:hypothetical protein